MRAFGAPGLATPHGLEAVANFSRARGRLVEWTRRDPSLDEQPPDEDQKAAKIILVQ
ncbi:MAG: hypothetical protein ACRDJ4_15290 [Actinomycetota bacterium]